MQTIVAKLTIEGKHSNQLLLVAVNDNMTISYMLKSERTHQNNCLSGLQLEKPLPILMLDYTSISDMIEDVITAIRSGVYKDVTVTTYSTRSQKFHKAKFTA
jgi:hypothetical protein